MTQEQFDELEALEKIQFNRLTNEQVRRYNQLIAMAEEDFVSTN